MSYQHSFVPDDEGLFCLFCGRTAVEHLGPAAEGDVRSAASFGNRSGDAAGGIGEVEEEDDWDAIQEELKRLTRRCQQESEAREKAEVLLAEMKSAFEKLREDVGHIRTWGANTDGQLGHYGGKPSLVEIRGILRQLSCGGAHTAALTDDGQLYVWGRGNEGQLGLGDYRPRTVPALVKALGEASAGTSVLQVACGGAHTIALCDNGDVYTWGANDEMQLGLGATFGRKVREWRSPSIWPRPSIWPHRKPCVTPSPLADTRRPCCHRSTGRSSWPSSPTRACFASRRAKTFRWR